MSVPPGGRVEVRRPSSGGGGGCLGVVAALWLILILASTCRYESRSAPVTPAGRQVENVSHLAQTR